VKLMGSPLLQIKHLILRRDDCEILRGVDLSLSAGQVHALLGLNGSGKSSLAYTIMGCDGYTPSSGQILFEGTNLAGISITERARLGITLAWQEPARFEGIPVGKYVGLGADGKGRQLAVEALEAVALSAGVYGYRAADSSLSGGERKRVELAAVYAMRPKLAILDEPDSGIDVISLTEIEKLIRGLASAGSAVLLITHREELLSTANQASLICAGRIQFTGDPVNARRYYSQRCRPHLQSFGSQPWDEGDPQIQQALAGSGRNPRLLSQQFSSSEPLDESS
jgi:Fe-S cluster assembly ATP-binding protein